MHEHEISTMMRTDIKTPVRNRYFYGKLLDTYHFELETNYMNAKRWLDNRLVSGFGVVCGLDVIPVPGSRNVKVTPGVAIDMWGREIIVPEESAPMLIPIPPSPPDSQAEVGQSRRQLEQSREFIQLVLCYHECESDPAPVLAGDCPTPEPCAASAIRERYKIEWRSARAPKRFRKPKMPDIVRGGQVEYADLVKLVTKEWNCLDLPNDPCIPLADVRIIDSETHECDEKDIDITVRPIVYSNDLLFHLLLSVIYEPTYTRK